MNAILRRNVGEKREGDQREREREQTIAKILGSASIIVERERIAAAR